MMSKPDWFPDWTGETAVIVASGPSAAMVPLRRARGRARFIAINTSWKLAPWADVLYACDLAWWDYAKGCPAFKGLKLTVDRRAAEMYPDVHLVGCRKPDDRFVVEPVGTVGWGGNSGFHALNLAVQFGAKRIVLVGYDMTIKAGCHWHGRHPGAMHNPTAGIAERWRRAVDAAAAVIEQLGVEVINASPVSALRSYPKMDFKAALSPKRLAATG